MSGSVINIVVPDALSVRDQRFRLAPGERRAVRHAAAGDAAEACGVADRDHCGDVSGKEAEGDVSEKIACQYDYARG